MRLYDRIMRDGLISGYGDTAIVGSASVDDFAKPIVRVIADDAMRNFYGDKNGSARPRDLGVLKPPYSCMWVEGDMPPVSYFGGWHARGDSALGDITPEYHVADPVERTAS